MTVADPEAIAIGEIAAIVEEREVGRIRTEINPTDMNSLVAKTDLSELTVLINWSEGIVPNDWSVEIALSDRTIPAVGTIDRSEVLPPARFAITKLKDIDLPQVISLVLSDA